MINFPLLLAAVDWGNVIFWAVIILGFFGRALSQLFQQKPNQAPPQKQQPMRPRQPKPLGNEVEEFLRRAIDQRRGEQPAEVEILQPVAPAGPPPFQMAEAAVAEVHAEDSQIGENVEEHVHSHIDTSQFADRESHLGSDIDQADDKMAARLHKVFDHQLGQFRREDRREVESTERASTPPEDIFRLKSQSLADALRNPGSLRQAIVLSEILHRPDDRW